MASKLAQQIGHLTQQQTPLAPELEPLLPEETTTEERQAIANWLGLLDLSNPTDPFSIAFVAIAAQQLRLEKAPDKIQIALETIFKELDARMAGLEAAAAATVERREMQLRDKLAEQCNFPLSPWGIVRNTLALGIAIAAGAGAAWTIEANRSLDPRGPVQLTKAQAEILTWGESPEGKRARQIMRWNEGLASGACKREVRDSGIVFRVGSQEVYEGFCVAYVEPASGRKYRDAE